jgi:GxxExxY protein
MLVHGELTERIISAAMAVHTELGPGLLESAYGACLEFELQRAGLCFERQVRLPVRYHSVDLDAGYRIDFIVNELVVVEIKAVERVIPLHRAQLLSYLRLSGLRVGLLVNFNVLHLRDGVHRMINTPGQSATVARNQR